MEDNEYSIESWLLEYTIRKEIPSITNEEYESMPYHKLLFFISLIEELKEKEQKAMQPNKVFNKGSVRQ